MGSVISFEAPSIGGTLPQLGDNCQFNRFKLAIGKPDISKISRHKRLLSRSGLAGRIPDEAYWVSDDQIRAYASCRDVQQVGSLHADRFLESQTMTCPIIRLMLMALVLSTGAHARTLEVGESKEFKMPSRAAAAAQDGDRIEIQPGEYFDCAIWKSNKLVVEGVGDPDKVVVTDKACQGKALFITVGVGITIRNLTLTRARVPDNNGAGIRSEGKNLMVDGVHFVNNQSGILSGTTGGIMVVRNSVFDRNGACEGACAHGIYVGNLDLLQVERTQFIGTQHAHHIKSRALRTEVIGCTIEDGRDGTASYEIEIPNGGSVVVRGNTIEKGPKAENRSVAIMIGAEGVVHPTREITVENNTFRNDGPWETVFVNNQTATEAVLRGNRLSGSVKPLRGDGQVIAGH